MLYLCLIAALVLGRRMNLANLFRNCNKIMKKSDVQKYQNISFLWQCQANAAGRIFQFAKLPNASNQIAFMVKPKQGLSLSKNKCFMAFPKKNISLYKSESFTLFSLSTLSNLIWQTNSLKYSSPICHRCCSNFTLVPFIKWLSSNKYLFYHLRSDNEFNFILKKISSFFFSF